MANKLWLGVTVIACSRVLFDLKIVSCSKEETFRILILRLEEEHFSERRVDKVNLEDNNHRHELQLDAFLSLCSHAAFNCRNIVFHLADSDLFFVLPATQIYYFSDRASSSNKTSSRPKLCSTMNLKIKMLIPRL